MNNYLIPANSKKSQLILNMFRPIDLGVLGFGALVTLMLMFALPGDSIVELIIKLLPIATCLLLVMPLPYYHNVLVFLREVFVFIQSQKTYVWRGWCATYEFDNNEKN